jgi:type II secretory pathway component PulF
LEINLLLMTPVVGRAIYLDALGRFCRAIGVLLKRKVDIQKALILAASSVESLLGKKMAGSISSQLAKGKKFSEGMDASGLFSRSFVWMVEKAEARGDLEDTLIEIAGYYDENFEYYRHAFILLEPFLIVIVGIFIGFIVVSMYTPLFMLPKLIR